MTDPPTIHAEPVETPVPSGLYVMCGLAGERWAVPVEDVSEVQQLAAVTALPEPEGALVGYLDLRGEVVPVVDGRLLLGRDPVAYHSGMVFVIATDAVGSVALVVDEVAGVAEAATPEGSSAPAATDLPVAALVRDASGLVPVLDISALTAEARRGVRS